MLAVEKHRATFMAPIPIGMALFISELCAVTFTGGSLNPARSFGPAAVQHLFHSSHWVYWVGPFIGTILAVACYKLFKFLEYELVNPGQDGTCPTSLLHHCVQANPSLQVMSRTTQLRTQSTRLRKSLKSAKLRLRRFESSSRMVDSTLSTLAPLAKAFSALKVSSAWPLMV